MNYRERVSTGIAGFDKTIDMLRMGDNVVWQVETVDSYRQVVLPYVEQAKKDRRRIVYFRFGSHPPLLSGEDGEIQVYEVDASLGFERFAITIHQIVEAEGRRVFYVFDCLTELLRFWYSDLMLGNFFQVTCPYLFQLDTVAYFALERNRHNFEAIARIRETTQCLLDLYVLEGELYIHPLKADGRYSPTMFFPHRIQGEQSISITSSFQAAELFSGLEWDKKHSDYWNTMIGEAREALHQGKQAEERHRDILLQLLIGQKARMYELCRKHLTLADLLKIASREIGTGCIGGKSVGMLLARKIIKTLGTEEHLPDYLEPDDSFFIGTDVFYTYIVQNGAWGLWVQQKTETGYLALAPILKEKLQSGSFSGGLKEEFIHVLEYFGQSPIIIRSSSLLEDNFGNAFAGKYESVFCVNQGTPRERLQAFEDAVRAVYASTMNPDALQYRKQRGLSLKDEQMAILVQRVSGDYYGNYFFPHAAGVGNSSNLYVWEKGMDMEQGMLRLVMGLGTRAVDRIIGDYVKIVALDDPLRLPGLIAQDEQKYSQKKADVLDLKTNIWRSVDVEELAALDLGVDKNMFFTTDFQEARRLRELGYGDRPVPKVLNFRKMLARREYTEVMRKVLKLLSGAYEYPVDIEFTVNFDREGRFRFNLVQCRPLQTRGLGKSSRLEGKVDREHCLFYSEGNFMGGNIRVALDYVIYVDVHPYLRLSEQEKYQVARHIGRLNQLLGEKEVLLMGPGRWGTTTASLGVPVHFTEISRMTAILEISCQKEGLMPELSYGSHFFQDLVESGVFYIALFRDHPGGSMQEEWLHKENLLEKFLPDAAAFGEVLKVLDGKGMELYSDIQKQVCFLTSTIF